MSTSFNTAAGAEGIKYDGTASPTDRDDSPIAANDYPFASDSSASGDEDEDSYGTGFEVVEEKEAEEEEIERWPPSSSRDDRSIRLSGDMRPAQESESDEEESSSSSSDEEEAPVRPRSSRPSMERTSSQVSFGGETNLETGSYNSFAVDSASASTMDSEYSKKDNSKQPPKPGLSFGSAMNIKTGSIIHRKSSLENTNYQSTAHATAASLAASYVALQDDGSSSTTTPPADGGDGSSTISSGSNLASNTFKYRPHQTKQPSVRNSALKTQSRYHPSKKLDSGVKAYSLKGSTSPSGSVTESTKDSSQASQSTPTTNNKRKIKLTEISKMYDLDGDGVLNAVEQAMRDRDRDGDGQLDNAEVYRIVQDQLQSQSDVKTYRKVALGLVCLVAILALSNFGTSWASAILSKDTVADSESGTIQSKETGEVMGYQDVGFTVELEELSDEEFEERRALVEAEMMEDPDHEDHVHRHLGKKNKKNKCQCSKIAFDHGKIREKDLQDLTRRCDGVNTVNVRRKWKNYDGAEDYDYDTICGPGTVVVRGRQKKKKNKNNKVRVVDKQVTFRRKEEERDFSLSCDCDNKGDCYCSGGAILQRAGHPCLINRDYDGASECDEGLVCYDPYGNTFGSGVCTSLQRYARANQVCQIDFGVDACESGHACYNIPGRKRSVGVGVIHTGICLRVMQRSAEFEVCDASYGVDSCVDGCRCLGVNGREIRGNRGIGYCAAVRTVAVKPTNSWYVNYSLGSEGQCINDGNNEPWDDTYATPGLCCDQKLWWMNQGQCVPALWG